MATPSSTLPAESHGHRSLAGYGSWGHTAGHDEHMCQGCALGKRNHFAASLLISQVTVVSNSDLVRSRQRLQRVPLEADSS